MIALLAALAASLPVTAPPAPPRPRFVFPVGGPAHIGTLPDQRFGGARHHGGQDVFARCGTPVLAARRGRVRRATFEAAAGNYIVINVPGGRSMVYMHLRRPARFGAGDHVRTGERIGRVGDTGDAEDCHLHFELWTAPGWFRGHAVDPLPFLRRLPRHRKFSLNADVPTSMRALLLALLIGVFAAVPAEAAVTTTTTPVKIKASLPDDEGNPVLLDGGVTYPSEGCPCPGVIVNHGFLGSWHDSEGLVQKLVAHGYVVLRYLSRGFGATPGEVDLVGPKETQDLLDAVHWLNDPANPVVGGMVVHNDIGQFGGSYGGAHAWALAASGDPAVRTTVPTATWTNIYNALVPNGVMLLAYANGFYASGYGPTAGLLASKLSTQQNYSQNLHRWMAEVNSGVGTQDAQAGMAQRSIGTDYGRVKVPVFIIQGLNDGLFNINQAVDAYQAMRAHHVPARLYLGGIGHPPSDGSLDSPEATYVGTEVLAWFDHYLKGVDNGIDRQPPIEFSQADYFHNTWDGTTRTAERYPFAKATRMHLCTTGASGGTLSAKRCPKAAPAVATNANAGTGYDQEPVTAGYAEDFKDGFAQALGMDVPDLTTAPTILNYETKPLAAPLTLAGIPRLHLRVSANAGFQLDPKLYDIAPGGKAKLLTRGAFSAAAPTIATHKVSFDVNGFSNTIPAGHRLRIALQTSDAPYLRPTPTPFAVALLAGTTAALPILGKG